MAEPRLTDKEACLSASRTCLKPQVCYVGEPGLAPRLRAPDSFSRKRHKHGGVGQLVYQESQTRKGKRKFSSAISPALILSCSLLVLYIERSQTEGLT